MSEAMTFHDPARDQHPDPCPDCGQTHLNGEHLIVHLPTAEPGVTRKGWEGCFDCWIKRTDPERPAVEEVRQAQGPDPAPVSRRTETTEGWGGRAG